MNFPLLLLVFFLSCLTSKLEGQRNETKYEEEGKIFKRMLSLIDQTMENNKLSPEISYPSELGAELFVSFSFVADFLWDGMKQRNETLGINGSTGLGDSDMEAQEIMLAIEIIWTDNLHSDESLNLLMVAEILDCHKFVDMALEAYPAWATFYNDFGRNIVHFMALSGHSELIFKALAFRNIQKTKKVVASNDPHLEDDCLESKVLQAWNLVDGARKTPAQYIIELGSDETVMELLDLDDSIALLTFQNGLHCLQTLAMSGRFDILLDIIEQNPILPITQFSIHGTLIHFIAKLWYLEEAKNVIKALWCMYPLTFVDGRNSVGSTPLSLIPEANISQFEPEYIYLNQIYDQIKVNEFINNDLFWGFPNKSVMMDLIAGNVTTINSTFARELGFFRKIFNVPLANRAHGKMLLEFVERNRSDLVSNLMRRYDFVPGNISDFLALAYVKASINPHIFEVLVSNTLNFLYAEQCENDTIKGCLATILIHLKTYESLDILVRYHPEVVLYQDIYYKGPLYHAIDSGSLYAIRAILSNQIAVEAMQVLDIDNKPLLFFPLAKGDHDVINYLMDNQVFPPFKIGNQGYAPIHLAAKVAPFETFKMVIREYGVTQISLLTHNLRNVLHMALTNPEMTLDYFKYIYYLDPAMASHRDAYYWTPLEFSTTIKYNFCRSCVRFLEQRLKFIKKSDAKSTPQTVADSHETKPPLEPLGDDELEILFAKDNIEPLTPKKCSKKKKKKLKSKTSKAKPSPRREDVEDQEYEVKKGEERITKDSIIREDFENIEVPPFFSKNNEKNFQENHCSSPIITVDPLDELKVVSNLPSQKKENIKFDHFETESLKEDEKFLEKADEPEIRNLPGQLQKEEKSFSIDENIINSASIGIGSGSSSSSSSSSSNFFDSSMDDYHNDSNNLYYLLIESALNEYCMNLRSRRETVDLVRGLAVPNEVVIEMLHFASINTNDVSCIKNRAILMRDYIYSLNDERRQIACVDALVSLLNRINMNQIRTLELWSMKDQISNAMIWGSYVKVGLLSYESASSSLYLSGMDAISQENEKNRLFHLQLR